VAAVKVADGELATGIRTVDDGYRCEGEKADGARCLLSEKKRAELVATLRGRINRAMNNYKTAIQNARLDKLTATESGWGFLAEVLFQAATGGLIGTLGHALKAIKAIKDSPLRMMGLPSDFEREFVKRVGSIDEGAVKEVLVTASKGIRAEIKSKGKGLSDSNRGAAEFLRVIQEMPAAIEEHVSENAPADLDDIDLAALTEAYDLPHHTVERYRSIVDDLVARYDSNQIGKIGAEDVNRSGRTHKVVRLTAFGSTRAALVDDHGTGKIFRYRAEDYYNDGEVEFVRWIDDDFVGLAEDVHRERVGEIPTYDLTEDVADSPVTPSYGMIIWRQQAQERQKPEITITPLPKPTITHIDEPEEGSGT
jgi:hypothetical protein